MRNDGQYGEYVELLAAARAFKWNICVANAGPKPMNIPYQREDGEDTKGSEDLSASRIRTRSARSDSSDEALPSSHTSSSIAIPQSTPGHTALWLAYYSRAQHYNSVRLPANADVSNAAAVNDWYAESRPEPQLFSGGSTSWVDPDVGKLQDLDLTSDSHDGPSSRATHTDSEEDAVARPKWRLRRRRNIIYSSDESSDEMQSPNETPEERSTPSTSVDSAGSPDNPASPLSKGSTSRASETVEVEDEGGQRGAKKARSSSR